MDSPVGIRYSIVLSGFFILRCDKCSQCLCEMFKHNKNNSSLVRPSIMEGPLMVSYQSFVRILM